MLYQGDCSVRVRGRRRVVVGAIGLALPIWTLMVPTAAGAAWANAVQNEYARQASHARAQGPDDLRLDGARTTPATKQQRQAALVAVNAVLAYGKEQPSSEGLSGYAVADGMGDLAVASGAATTADSNDPSTPVGVNLSPAIEPTGPYQVVDFDGVKMVHASYNNGAGEIVGSTGIGSDRHVIILNSAAAPTTYSFSLTNEEVVEGRAFRLSTTTPGEAEVVNAAGQITATVAEPWARTVNGDPVPTSFSVSNGKLIQSIDVSGLSPEVFPVTADPSVTRNCGVFTCTWYFSVTRTKKLANDLLTPAGNLAAGVNAAMICGIFTIAAAGTAGASLLLGVVCAGLTGALIYSMQTNLHDARKNSRCFTISSPPRGPFGHVAYSNGNCHLK